jgi:RNA 2',3'-cyclic 3'-phosphodiesterase
MRTFIAIDIPKEIKEEIIKIQKQLPYFKGKLTEKENLHLTLKFLGEIDENKLKEIKKILGEIKLGSFETEIDSIGFFDNNKSKLYERQIIVWLHMKNCEKLQKDIDESLSVLFEKEKRFMAHLTIARVKETKDKKDFFEKIMRIKIPPMKFPVKKFRLKKSTLTEKGSIYEDIEVYQLEI